MKYIVLRCTFGNIIIWDTVQAFKMVTTFLEKRSYSDLWQTGNVNSNINIQGGR